MIKEVKNQQKVKNVLKTKPKSGLKVVSTIFKQVFLL